MKRGSQETKGTSDKQERGSNGSPVSRTWSRMAGVTMLLVWALAWSACDEDRRQSGDASVGRDVVGGGDGTAGWDAAAGTDARAMDGSSPKDAQTSADGQAQQDGALPGTDTCSGNSYTPSQPGTGQGTAPGDASTEQVTAMQYMNSFRNLMGLNPIDLNSALDQACVAHSEYCSQDSSWCPGWHQEEEGHPGFTGVNFWDRDRAAGYQGQPAMEVMAPGGTPQYAIDMWMESVYHRSPFVDPAIHEAGYGSGASFTTMDFGCCGPYDHNLVTNYPVDGQTGVPRSWSGNEGPQPPTPPTGWPSGPVISVVFPPDANVTITAHEIYDDACNPVAHVAGGQGIQPNPGFDERFLGSAVALYPNDPLAGGKTYVVNVEYTMNGSPGHRTFRFTTE